MDLHRALLLVEASASNGEQDKARQQLKALVETASTRIERLDRAFLTRLGRLWTQLLPLGDTDDDNRAFETMLATIPRDDWGRLPSRIRDAITDIRAHITSKHPANSEANAFSRRLDQLDKGPNKQSSDAGQQSTEDRPPETEEQMARRFSEQYKDAFLISHKQALAREIRDSGRPELAVVVWTTTVDEQKCAKLAELLLEALPAAKSDLDPAAFPAVVEALGTRASACARNGELQLGVLTRLAAGLDPTDREELSRAVVATESGLGPPARSLPADVREALEAEPPNDERARPEQGTDNRYLLVKLLARAELLVLARESQQVAEYLAMAEALLHRIDRIEHDTGAPIRDTGDPEPWTLVGEMWLSLAQPDNAHKALVSARSQMLPSQEKESRSRELARIALAYGALGYHRTARLTADQCLTAERMQVYPELAAQMATGK